jgi:hypothetical protein
VLRLVAAGKPKKQIAAEFAISERTSQEARSADPPQALSELAQPGCSLGVRERLLEMECEPHQRSAPTCLIRLGANVALNGADRASEIPGV